MDTNKLRKIKVSWKDYNTKDDFQKFIDENHIESSTVLWKNYIGLVARAKRLGINVGKDLDYHKKSSVTLEEANKFVKDNNIRSLSELNRKYHEQYLLFVKVRKNIEFPFEEISWEGYTVEKIQDFINDEGIKSRKEFMERYPTLYWGCHRKDFMKDLVFEKDSAFVKYKLKERFNSVEDIHSYLAETGITRFKQLNSTEEGKAIRNYAYRMGWKIEFLEKPNSWTDYNTKEDFQKYIDENHIQCPAELSRGFYNRMHDLGFHKEVTYTRDRKRSTLEIKVAKKLEELGIEFEEQVTFSDLKDKARLRIDFIIRSKKLMIEPGDIQHLKHIEHHVGEDFETIQRHDKMKRDYCKKIGYTMIYYFENGFKKYVNDEEFKRLVSEYPGECYTKETFDQMFERILSL